MISIKNPNQIANMRVASKVLAEGLNKLRAMAKVGVNCLELEQTFAKHIKNHNCESNFKGYHGFPATICISINEQLIHGIPQDRILNDGDILSIDAGCIYQDIHADSALTMIVGNPKTEEDIKLVKTTHDALHAAIHLAAPGVRIGDLSALIQSFADKEGYGVPQDYAGHGIGTSMHEDPFIPNFGVPNTGIRLVEGMTICIEPMFQTKTHKTKVLKDNWTVISADNSNAAHYEHTILITSDGCEVLTRRK